MREGLSRPDLRRLPLTPIRLTRNFRIRFRAHVRIRACCMEWCPMPAGLASSCDATARARYSVPSIPLRVEEAGTRRSDDTTGSRPGAGWNRQGWEAGTRGLELVRRRVARGRIEVWFRNVKGMEMREPDVVNEALAAFDREYAQWTQALNAIGMDRMDVPGMMGEWPAKQLVAHLTAWQWKTLASFRASVQGTPYPPPPWPAELNDPDSWEEDGDFEAINQWVHDRAEQADAAKIVEYSLKQWDDIRAVIAGLTPEQLQDAALFPRLEGRSLAQVLAEGLIFEHFQEHEDEDIRPWLERNGAETS